MVKLFDGGGDVSLVFSKVSSYKTKSLKYAVIIPDPWSRHPVEPLLRILSSLFYMRIPWKKPGSHPHRQEHLTIL